MAAYARFSLDRRSSYWFQSADGAWHELGAEEGVDQGAPLSPAFFAVGVAPALQRLEERLRTAAADRGSDPEEVTLIAYLDDVLLGLPASLVRDGCEWAKEELGAAGLDLNLKKTCAWAAEAPEAELLTWLTEQGYWRPEGFRLLGTPLAGGRELALGTEAFTRAFLHEKCNEARRLVRKVAELPALAMSGRARKLPYSSYASAAASRLAICSAQRHLALSWRRRRRSTRRSSAQPSK